MTKRVCALLALVTGCATIEFAPRKSTLLDQPSAPGVVDPSAAPFASTMPSATVLQIPPPTIASETRLKNGIRVMLIERHEEPLVAIGVVLQRGSVEAPPGVFDLFVASLSSGSDLISPKALHRDLWVYAVRRKLDVRREYSVVSAQFIAPLMHDVLRMIVPTFATPSFDSEELDDLIDQHKRFAGRSRDEPRASAHRELYKLLFPGGSPYADDPADSAKPLDGVTVATVRALRPLVAADDITIVAAGDVTLATLQTQLEAAIGSLGSGARARKEVPASSPPTSPHVLLLDHPHDSQAQLALGYPGVKYDDPDFPALYALSKIIQDGARVSLRLAHGVTYGVSSGIAMMRTPAPVVLTVAVDATRVTQAITDTFASVKDFAARLEKPGELERLKSWIVANYTTYDTVDEALEALKPLAALDLPVDHWSKLRTAIEALTQADLVRVAERYLAPSHAQLVVLGDANLLRAELDALAIAPVEVRKVAH